MNEQIDLTQFGWDGLSIPANLTNVCKSLPKWNKLKCLRDTALIGHHLVHFPHHYFRDAGGAVFMPALVKKELHNDHGGYSQIYKAERALYKPTGDLYGAVKLDRIQGFEDICIKEMVLRIGRATDQEEYEEEINAILYEAYLHALLYKTLEKHDYESFIPRLYEITARTKTYDIARAITDLHAIWMTMEFLEGSTFEKCLQHMFTRDKRANSALLKQILLQLCFLLHFLQKTLRFNHRDLKINNVYIRSHDASEAWRRTLVFDDGRVFECDIDAVLLDFGFSCIACGSGFRNPRATLLGAGVYFTSDDDCMKEGRDLAQFLYSLHCSFPLQHYILPEMFDVLHAAMKTNLGRTHHDLWKGIDERGDPYVMTELPPAIRYNNGIYAYLRQNDLEIPGCIPAVLAGALLSLSL